MQFQCLACGDVKPNLINIRGKEIFERELQDFSNKSLKKDGPLCVCEECMLHIYDNTQKNPLTLTVSLTDVLRDTVDSPNQSPDSSMDVVSDSNSSRSMIGGTPASSESIDLPKVISIITDSIETPSSEELLPPYDPNDKETTESEELRLQRAAVEKLRNIKAMKAMKSQKRKRPSAPPSVSSSASSIQISFTSSNEEVRAILPLSPKSSQLKTQSPFTKPAVPPRKKLIPSKKPTHPDYSSVTSPSTQPSPVNSPPLNIGQRRYVSSNSDHSNGAAPRRYQYIDPVTNLGSNGRAIREPSIKNFGG